MKRFLSILAFVAICASTAYAQKPIPQAVSLKKQKEATRTEIILPQVQGYNCYKGDFHVHTTYSDGRMNPAARIVEAWMDGLDIVAITDHHEKHKGVKNMLNVISMKDSTVIDYKKAKVSHNKIHEEAVEQIEKSGWPMLLVKGAEVTRDSQTVGHLNCLFLTDIDAIFDKDPAEALRKAKAQGGIVIHNHPAWRRGTCDKTEFHQLVYGEGLVDGVEVVNGGTLYPPIVRRCLEEKLALFANTDEHNITEYRFGTQGDYRTMTLILAKELTEEAVKDAILNQRTIAFARGFLIGQEMWLKDFLNAAIDCRITKDDGEKRTFLVRNNSSVTFHLRRGIVHTLEPFQIMTISIGRDKTTGEYAAPVFTIDNMWQEDYKHPKFELELDM